MDKVCYKYTGTGVYDTFLNKYKKKSIKVFKYIKNKVNYLSIFNLTGSATVYIYFLVFDLLFLGIGYYIIKPQIMTDYLSYDNVMEVIHIRLSLNK